MSEPAREVGIRAGWQPPRRVGRRLDVDNWPDDSGHRWQWLYFERVLVDVRCADCGKRPLDLIETNRGALVPCPPRTTSERTTPS